MRQWLAKQTNLATCCFFVLVFFVHSSVFLGAHVSAASLPLSLAGTLSYISYVWIIIGFILSVVFLHLCRKIILIWFDNPASGLYAFVHLTNNSNICLPCRIDPSGPLLSNNLMSHLVYTALYDVLAVITDLGFTWNEEHCDKASFLRFHLLSGSRNFYLQDEPKIG